MPLQTCNIAKGIAPRLHLPKSTKPKPKPQTDRAGKSRKRDSSESMDESSHSESPKPVKKRKKRAKQVTVSIDLEEVEQVEVVEGVKEQVELEFPESDEAEVSTNEQPHQSIHLHTHRIMTQSLIAINVVMSPSSS